MSNQNYIINILNLKEENLFFKENFYYESKIKGITHKIFEAYLSYKPTHCTKCGVIFDDSFEKHGFIISNIKIPDISGFKAILKLHKQRYLCKHCNKAFTLSTNIVNYGCFISNNTKYKIATELTKKRSEKDIAIDNNVSPNTVERIMDSYYETQKLYKHHLPEVLCFDEFKSVKSADGAMSFHMCDGITGQTIDIVEDRRLDKLIKYFFYYDYKARSKVKFIIIDMYSPYISLIKKMFPNASIIIDKFHLTQLISRSLNKTRIMIMKKFKKHHRKFKRYWKLILKSRDELDISKWKRWTCFDPLMTESDVVDFLINLDDELKQTYIIYQNILHALKNKNYDLLKQTLNSYNPNISSYMKISIKTLLEFLPFIKNTFNNNYHNGYIEGNNNFIKVIKRIAFGFRSFRRFKARIMICKGLLKIKKIANA
ncbi:MAG: ISL3 family transposase [Bacilli bacterium]|nr:ISL3 family transposase [Bacilli bacterium]